MVIPAASPRFMKARRAALARDKRATAAVEAARAGFRELDIALRDDVIDSAEFVAGLRSLSYAPQIQMRSRLMYAAAFATAYRAYVKVAAHRNNPAILDQLDVVAREKAWPPGRYVETTLRLVIDYDSEWERETNELQRRKLRSNALKQLSRDARALQHLIAEKVSPDEVVPFALARGEGLEAWSRAFKVRPPAPKGMQSKQPATAENDDIRDGQPSAPDLDIRPPVIDDEIQTAATTESGSSENDQDELDTDPVPHGHMLTEEERLIELGRAVEQAIGRPESRNRRYLIVIQRLIDAPPQCVFLQSFSPLSGMHIQRLKRDAATFVEPRTGSSGVPPRSALSLTGAEPSPPEHLGERRKKNAR